VLIIAICQAHQVEKVEKGEPRKGRNRLVSDLVIKLIGFSLSSREHRLEPQSKARKFLSSDVRSESSWHKNHLTVQSNGLGVKVTRLESLLIGTDKFAVDVSPHFKG
jgi:hypothetical protein